VWVSRKRFQDLEYRVSEIDSIIDDVLKRVTESERTLHEEIQRFKALNDEIDYRIERGNARWREIRARERRQEELEESERLSEGDARGSDQEEVFPMHGGMAESTHSPVEAARRALARAIAGNPNL